MNCAIVLALSAVLLPSVAAFAQATPSVFTNSSVNPAIPSPGITVQSQAWTLRARTESMSL